MTENSESCRYIMPNVNETMTGQADGINFLDGFHVIRIIFGVEHLFCLTHSTTINMESLREKVTVLVQINMD